MALPSRPNARLGLPTNPAPHARSRSLVATARGRPGLSPTDRPNSSASEALPERTFSPPPPLPRNAGSSQLRAQRSLGNMSIRSRAQSTERLWEQPRVPPPPPPMPPKVPLPPLPLARKTKPAMVRVESGNSDIMEYYTGDCADRKNSDASLSSASSSSSSSSGSSHSSLDFSDVEASKEGEDNNNGPHGYPVPAGFGSSLWSRVAAAAGNLSISVSKAWAVNVPKLGGEDTPPGQESRLTRAMKAYHIEKAREPTDLPEWLFQDRERGVRRVAETTNTPAQQQQAERMRAPSPVRVPPPREIAPALPVEVRRSHTVIKHESVARARDALDGGQEHTSQAVQRLRKIRSAKRLAKVRFADGDGDGDEDGVPPVPSSGSLSLDVVIPNSSLGVNVSESAAWGVSPTRSPMERGKNPSVRVGLPSSVRIRRN